jgi:biopolymer transport protein ExbD
MAFKEYKVQEEVSPNLIPMIDIMFLLLLFFMLNADMSARELEELTVPKAEAGQMEDKESGGDRITVNVHHDIPDKVNCSAFITGQVCREDAHWHISVSGRSYDLSKAGMDRLAQGLTELAKSRKANPADPNSPSERRVLIRADRQAPYGHVQKVLEASAVARLYKIEVGVGIPKESIKQ